MRAEFAAWPILWHLQYMETNPSTAQQLQALYHQAFTLFRAKALWNMQPAAHPTPCAVLAITQALRQHGAMEGRRLAEEIERLCHAPD